VDSYDNAVGDGGVAANGDMVGVVGAVNGHGGV
jgi:hypothetical protein